MNYEIYNPELLYKWWQEKNWHLDTYDDATISFEPDSDDPTIAYYSFIDAKEPDATFIYKVKNGFVVEIADAFWFQTEQ
jgi:hypothetical protein